MSRALRFYVAAVVALSLWSITTVSWGAIGALPGASWFGLIALIGLGLLSESLALPVRLGKDADTSSSITFIPLLAAALLFGRPAAVIFFATTGLFGEVLRRKGLVRGVFNLSQTVLSTVVAGAAWEWLGGEPLAPELGFGSSFTDQLLPFAAFGVVFLAVNHTAVSIAVGLSQGMEIKRAWRLLVGSSGSNVLYDFLISPIALAVVLLYLQLRTPGLFVVLLPLLFIRHAYLTTFRLQEANRNLLKALIKAIETRDPYTSGHSRRVSVLARRIAETLHLPVRQVEIVETAALLHDIGKIDAVFTEILRKKGALSSEERRVIESHVIRGVELLEQMGSFPKAVLLSVRHHHERIDGRGYPDGLRAREIPLGARIIKVCDAIDAMLSDRPYRRALTISEVKQQLVEYAGVQFDVEIVQQVISSTVLVDHREGVRTELAGMGDTNQVAVAEGLAEHAFGRPAFNH